MKIRIVLAGACWAGAVSCGPRPGGPVKSAAPLASDDEVLAGAIVAFLAMGTDAKVESLAEEVLVDLGPAAADPLLQAWDEADDRLKTLCLLVLGQMDPVPEEAQRLAMEALGSSDRRLRANAMTVLGGRCKEDPGLVDLLLEEAEGDDDLVGRAAMGALGGCGTGDPRVLETLLQSLEIDENAGGIEGIAALGDLAAPALPTLMSYIASGEGSLPEAAARAIEKLGPAAAPVAEALEDAYETSEYVECLYMGDALLAVQGTGAFDSFLRMMRDSGDDECRDRATELIREMGPDALPSVIEAFDGSNDVDLRNALIESIETKGAEPGVVVPFLARAFAADGGRHESEVVEVLVRMGEPVVGPLVALYESGQADDRWLAVQVLRWFSHLADAGRTLLSATADADVRIRLVAIDGLGIGLSTPDEIETALERALSDESPVVRAAAYDVLVTKRDEIADSTARLLAGLEDPDADVRSTIVSSLPLLVDPDHAQDAQTVLDALRSTLVGDDDADVRRLAAEGLWQARDASEPTIDALVKALDDEAAPVVDRAAAALARIGQPAARASAKLASLLNKGKVNKGNLALAIAWVDPGSKALVKWLGKALKSKDGVTLEPAIRVASMLRPCPSGVMASLVDVARKDTAQQRWAAARALASTGEAGVEALAEMVGEVDEDLDREIVTSLGDPGVDATPAYPSILVLLDDQDPDIRALACRAMGKVAPDTEGMQDALVGRLTDEDPDVRTQAALQLLLHDHSAPEAVDTFRELIDDPGSREGALSTLETCASACSEMLATLVEIFRERMAARAQARKDEDTAPDDDDAGMDGESWDEEGWDEEGGDEDGETSAEWDTHLDALLFSSVERMLVASPQNIPLLIEVRAAGDPYKNVIGLLAQVGAPAELAIHEMLRTGTVEEQKQALSMLADLKANDAETLLLIEEVAATGAPETQLMAASTLCHLDSPGAEVMISVLKQGTGQAAPTSGLLLDIICVVGSIGGWRDQLAEMQGDEAPRELQKQLEDAAVPVILAALASDDDRLRYLAVACIVVGQRSLPEAREDLLPLLTDENELVRTLAFLAMAMALGDEDLGLRVN